MAKQYAEAESYEEKLEKVMSRLGVEKYNYNWDRFACWVEFFYKGQLYRFEHSIENAKNHGQTVKYGSDIFAQVVLSLQDIARMVERGIYDLSTWVVGMKALPGKLEIPICFQKLYFSEIPGEAALKERYKVLAKQAHPDMPGGNEKMFVYIKSAYDEAMAYLKKGS